MSEENRTGELVPQQDSGASANEETHALRWRSAILRLSSAFMDAADERRDLSPILLEALHNALDNLLVYGEADDLLVLEEWLSMEEDSRGAAWRRERRTSDRRSYERRFADRRFSDRRQQRADTRMALPGCVMEERRLGEDRRQVTRRESGEESDRRTSGRRAPRDWQFDEIKIPAIPN